MENNILPYLKDKKEEIIEKDMGKIVKMKFWFKIKRKNKTTSHLSVM